MVEREGSISVLNDPQFGLTAILRPYVGFDAQTGGVECYQGVSGDTPIMFTEGGVVFDPQAGKPGYSKRLIKGLSVPFGTRISIWLPSLTTFSGTEDSTTVKYTWQLIWRQRNVFDYRAQRIAFHYPKQGIGVPDLTAGDQPPERVIIPAAGHSIIVNSANPGSSTSATVDPFDAIGQVFSERFRPTKAIGMSALPLAPAVPGIVPPTPMAIVAQGILDFGALGAKAYFPIFQTVEVQALGDELLIACTKDVSSTGSFVNWDFTAVLQDLLFSFIFGTVVQPNSENLLGGPFPDLGVYVNVGVAT